MSRKNKKCKQRGLDLEANSGTVISNLAANENNSTQMECLKQLQEMFADRIEPDLIHDVFQECAGNGLFKCQTVSMSFFPSLSELLPNI